MRVKLTGKYGGSYVPIFFSYFELLHESFILPVLF